ncbi:GntR family transcriptional regulator [Luteococcus peritonei]
MAGVVKHAALHDLLAKRIVDMEPGDKLPTEADLCEAYKVSRITVRRALGDLEREGLLVREQGRGTFVARPTIPQVFRENLSARVIGFHQQQALLGNRVATTVVSNEVVFNIEMAGRLGLAPSSPLARIERLRYVNNQLHQHCVTWLDGVRYPNIVDHDFTDASLFDYLGRAHGVILERNELTVSIVGARGGVAELLEVPEGTPLLGMQSVVFDETGGLVALSMTTHAPGHGEISICVGKEPSQ